MIASSGQQDQQLEAAKALADRARVMKEQVAAAENALQEERRRADQAKKSKHVK